MANAFAPLYTAFDTLAQLPHEQFALAVENKEVSTLVKPSLSNALGEHLNSVDVDYQKYIG